MPDSLLRSRRAWLAPLLLAAILLLGFSAWRAAPSLAGRVALLMAETYGLEPQGLEVRHLGWGRVDLGNIVLGREGETRIAALSLRFSLARLLRRRLEALKASGLRVRAVLGSGGLDLGPLQVLLEKGEGPGFIVREAVARDGILDLSTPLGRSRIHFEGDASMPGPGLLEAAARYSVGEGDQTPGGNLQLAREEDRFTLTGTLRSPDDRMRIDIDFGPDEAPDATRSASRATRGIEGQGSLRLGFRNIDLSGIATGFHAEGAVAFAVTKGGARFWSDEGISAGAEALDARLLAKTVPTADRPPMLSQPLALKLGATGAGQPMASLRFKEDGWEVALFSPLRVTTNEWRFGDGKTAFGPVDVSIVADGVVRENHLRVRLREGGRLGLGRLRVARFASALPAEWRLSPAQDAPLLGLRREGEAWAGQAAIVLEPASLELRSDGGPAWMRNIHATTPKLMANLQLPGAGTPATFAIASEGGGFSLPALGITVRDLRAGLRGTLGREGLSIAGDWEHSAIESDRKPPLICPLTLSGRISSVKETARVSASVRSRGRSLDVGLEASHDWTRDRGRARIVIRPVRFKPGALEARDLLPGFGKRISALQGAVRGSGELRWSPAGLQSPFDLRVDGLSFYGFGARVAGLDADVSFASTLPPRTSAGQTITVARIASIVTLKDGVARFGITDEGDIAFEKIAARTLGGAIEGSGTVALDGRSGRILLHAEGISVARLLRLVNVDGLEGNGTLSGDLPVHVENRRLLIREARLRAGAEGGELHYRPATRPAAFPRNDENIDLALAIMENFHYDKLVLSLAGEPAEEIELGLALKGANPDVKGGYPVAFDLTLSGFFLDLMRGATFASRLSEEIGKRLRRD